MKTSRKDAMIAGDKEYYNGIPCPQGHVSKRRTTSGSCCECKKNTLKKWRIKNPDSVKTHNQAQYAAHANTIKENAKNYYLANKDIVMEKVKEYRAKNPHIHAKCSAKQRALRLQRIPKWLTNDHKKVVNAYYSIAQRLTCENNEPWQVDHIVPLQGKLVSGLHVPWNLQLMKRSENRAKSNSFGVNP